MTPHQMAAYQNNNDQRKAAIAAVTPSTPAATAVKLAEDAASDVEALLTELKKLTAKLNQSDKNNKLLMQDLAECGRERERHRVQAADCMATVGPMRDKLAKARRLLKKYTFDDPSPDDIADRKDVLRKP